MRLREQTNDPTKPPSDVPAATEPNSLDALAAEGATFLAAGHDIISAALSGNSEAFLNANRQMGGE